MSKEGYTISLRDYQVSISEKASQLMLGPNGFSYLAMEVRCGKTLTSLQAMSLLGCENILFVTKKKAISSIQSDYTALNPAYAITIINYESLHHVNEVFDGIIVDEAHGLGAFPKPSIRAIELKRIVSAGNSYVLYLSGTPSPESYSQFYHQMWILGDRSPFSGYRNFYRWADDYVKVWQRMISGNRINVYDNGIKEKIMEVLEPHMITFTQSEAGFTSKVEEEVLYVEMKPSTYSMIATLKADLLIEGATDIILADTPAKLMQKLHQMYSGTIILESGKRLVFDTTKAEFIRERFKGKRIAVFYKFQAELDCLLSVFQEDITTDLGKFHAGDCNNFAVQIVTGREGISLKQADYLVYYNIDFSATSYWQSRDRLTTMDRLSNNVYWIFAKDGIEEKIYKVVQQKKQYTLNHFKKDLNL